MITKRQVAMCLTAGALLVLSACSSGSSSAPAGSGSSGTPASGGNLAFEFFTAPLDLDPSTSQDNDTSMQMWLAWFQGLVQVNPSGPGFLPLLADHWSVSTDKLT